MATRFCATAKVKNHFKPVYSDEALKANIWNSEFGISVDASMIDGEEVFEVWLTHGYKNGFTKKGECERVVKLGEITKEKYAMYLR